MDLLSNAQASLLLIGVAGVIGTMVLTVVIHIFDNKEDIQ